MERDFCCPPRKQDIVRRTGREARWGSANDPALGSSHFETGSDGDGLFRPRSPGSGREHLHLRPVVRELSAAIEPDDVSSGYGGYCSITTQLAAHSYGEATPLMPTTEDPVEKIHKPSSIEATIDAATRNCRPSAQARVRFWIGLIFRIPNRSRYARPRPQYQPPPPSKNTIKTTTKIVSTLIIEVLRKRV